MNAPANIPLIADPAIAKLVSALVAYDKSQARQPVRKGNEARWGVWSDADTERLCELADAAKDFFAPYLTELDTALGLWSDECHESADHVRDEASGEWLSSDDDGYNAAQRAGEA